MPIFCIKSVKIYTGQKKITRVYPWDPWQIWGMVPQLQAAPYPAGKQYITMYCNILHIIYYKLFFTQNWLAGCNTRDKKWGRTSPKMASKHAMCRHRCGSMRKKGEKYPMLDKGPLGLKVLPMREKMSNLSIWICSLRNNSHHHEKYECTSLVGQFWDGASKNIQDTSQN